MKASKMSVTPSLYMCTQFLSLPFHSNMSFQRIGPLTTSLSESEGHRDKREAEREICMYGVSATAASYLN